MRVYEQQHLKIIREHTWALAVLPYISILGVAVVCQFCSFACSPCSWCQKGHWAVFATWCFDSQPPPSQLEAETVEDKEVQDGGDEGDFWKVSIHKWSQPELGLFSTDWGDVDMAGAGSHKECVKWSLLIDMIWQYTWHWALFIWIDCTQSTDLP